MVEQQGPPEIRSMNYCSGGTAGKLTPIDYERWLSQEPDPKDLLKPFPSEPMRKQGP
jgi:hypothetical protein